MRLIGEAIDALESRNWVSIGADGQADKSTM